MMTIGKKLHEKVKPHAKRIAGIAHPHRLAILYLLAHDPMWVRDLVNYLGLPENLISHHLKQMYEAGWVSKEKQGRTVTYRLNEKTFLTCRNYCWIRLLAGYVLKLQKPLEPPNRIELLSAVYKTVALPLS